MCPMMRESVCGLVREIVVGNVSQKTMGREQGAWGITQLNEGHLEYLVAGRVRYAMCLEV